eukprot:1142775-Pelagomonas_calceolata.AAC.2
MSGQGKDQGKGCREMQTGSFIPCKRATGNTFEYPIRILAAAAAAAAAAVPDADDDAWKLCCWIAAAGGDWRSSVQE